MGLFGNKKDNSLSQGGVSSGQTSVAPSTPQEMMNKAKALEDTAAQGVSYGDMMDFPVCTDGAGKSWEISFVINLNAEQTALVKGTPSSQAAVSMVALNAGRVVVPIIMLKLNNDSRLAFACATRYGVIGKGTAELASLDYFSILMAQEKLNVFVRFEGERGIVMPITNRLRLSPALAQIKEQADTTVATLLKESPFLFDISDAIRSVKNMVKSQSPGKGFGQFIWEKYGD